jgi:outer membrane protein TolC
MMCEKWSCVQTNNHRSSSAMDEINSSARIRLLPMLGALGLALILSGCQTFSPNGGMELVSAVAGTELKKDMVAVRTAEDAEAARAVVARLLKRPLTAETAVQIALLNNRGLQAAYNELGIAEAVRVGQSLPPNPSFSISRLSGPVETEIDRQIVISILALATLPMRAEIAADRFQQAQLIAALETLRVAAAARRAYYRTVAAREIADFLAQANSAADTAAKLATRLGETGAMNKLDQAREQVFYADLTTQLANARQRASSEREQLVRVLGLWGSDLNFTLLNKLPALPRQPQALPTIEQEAVSRRVDLQIARIELETLAKAYGLTQATRFINVLDAGYADRITKNKETGEKVRDRGFTVSFEVPLFDFGEVRVREAEQIYLQAVNRLAEKAVDVRSQARDAYRTYRSTYDIARHYESEVLPLRKIISDETQLRYNAMQIDVFSLLTEARQRILATIAAIEARRTFYLAQTDLKVAIIGGGPVGTASEGPKTVTATTAGAD